LYLPRLTSLDSSPQSGDPVQPVLCAGLDLCLAAGLAQASLLGGASRGRFWTQYFCHVSSGLGARVSESQSVLVEIVVLNSKNRAGDVERSMDQRVEQ
jgi:hypothetical protein